MPTAAAPKRAATPIVTPTVTPTPVRRAAPAIADGLAQNPLYALATDPNRDPEARAQAIRKFFEAPATKAEAAARIEALNQVTEHLQSVRQSVARRIIELTDTRVFGELQGCFGDMNRDLVDYEGRLRPLVETVEAVNRLREQNKTVEAFLEIREDRQREAERDAEVNERGLRLAQIETEVDALERDVARLRTPRGPGGIFGVSRSARAEAALAEARLGQLRDEVARIGDEIRALRAPIEAESQLGELTAAKDRLREFLDLTSDEHAQRQAGLVSAALEFVKTSDERIGAVRGHLGELGAQVERLVESNGSLGAVYAVLADGVRGAAADNQALRRAAAEAPPDESALARMAREERQQVIEEYLARLGTVGAQTTQTHAELLTERSRVTTMRTDVQGQIERARLLGTQGVAGVAGRLSQVLQAVNSAALTQSSGVAAETLRRMTESTDALAQSETMRVALGQQELNVDVERAITALAQYGETTERATEVTRQLQDEMRANLAELETAAGQLRAGLRDASSVAADASLPSDGAPPSRSSVAAPAGSPDPFAGLVTR